ncbi:MAG: hypothetical protein M1820_009184 [Bogoriella megaspora]|nr:MAG: hypothetical protein M1820_009184 [Bogoriella megaspora]
MDVPYQMDFVDRHIENENRASSRGRDPYYFQESPCPVTPPIAEHDERSFQEALQSIKKEIQQMNSHYTSVLRTAEKVSQPPLAPPMMPTQVQAAGQPDPSLKQLLQSLRSEIRGLDARVELMEARYDLLDDRLDRLEPGTPSTTPSTTQLVDLDPPEIATSTTAWPLKDDKDTEKKTPELPLAEPDDIGYFDPQEHGLILTMGGPYYAKPYYHDVMFFTKEVLEVAKEKKITCLKSCLRNKALVWWSFLDTQTRNDIQNGDMEKACSALVSHFAISRDTVFRELASEKYTNQDALAGRDIRDDFGMKIIRLLMHAGFKGAELDKCAKIEIHKRLLLGAHSPMNPPPPLVPLPNQTVMEYLGVLREQQPRIKMQAEQIGRESPGTGDYDQGRGRLPPPKFKASERKYPEPVLERLAQPLGERYPLPEFRSRSSSPAASPVPRKAPSPPPPSRRPISLAGGVPPPMTSRLPPPKFVRTPSPPSRGNLTRPPPPPPPKVPAPTVRFEAAPPTIPNPHTVLRRPPPKLNRSPQFVHRSQSMHHLGSQPQLSQPPQGRANPVPVPTFVRRTNPYRNANEGSGSENGQRASVGYQDTGDEERAFQRALRNSRTDF